jgi:hypothetical protein
MVVFIFKHFFFNYTNKTFKLYFLLYNCRSSIINKGGYQYLGDAIYKL